MNERIQQLAEQAGLNDAYMNFDHKYFAQLIVRECLGIVQDAERGSNEIWDNAALSWNNAVKFIRRDLQEHFGVEE